jgi:hypothetical protein
VESNAGRIFGSICCNMAVDDDNDVDSKNDAMENRSVGFRIDVPGTLLLAVVVVVFDVLLQYNSHCTNCVCKKFHVAS